MRAGLLALDSPAFSSTIPTRMLTKHGPTRSARFVVLLCAAVSLAGCADKMPLTSPASAAEVAHQRAILDGLAEAGYRGPVAIQAAQGFDANGTGQIRYSISLPEPGREALARGIATEPAAASALQRALGSSAILSAGCFEPCNTPTDALGGVVLPSVLTGGINQRSRILVRNTFWTYDYQLSEWYQVLNGTVLDRTINAREHAGGHIHGAVESQKRAREGYAEPETGVLPQALVNAQYADVWFAPEFAQEVKFDYQLRFVPRRETEAVELWFNGGRAFATRVVDLLPMGFGLEIDNEGPWYDLVGQTSAHPNNTWYARGMNTAIRRTAWAYFITSRAAGRPDKTKVNDISLPYGGRFDAGRTVSRAWVSCGDANLAVCWGFSHYEHRFGTEVDIKPYRWNDPAAHAEMLRLLRRQFATVHVEGDHFHARTAASIFN